MNEKPIEWCFLWLGPCLTSAEWAAWVQAGVSSLAVAVGAWVVYWQTKRARLEMSEREARALDGLARLLVHLKDCAIEARAERHKIRRWPIGHPAEPSSRYLELADAIHRYPLEALQGEAPLEALLNARRAARELQPVVSSDPELDINPNYQAVFEQYIGIIEQQILMLRAEAERLFQGHQASHAAAVQIKSKGQK